MRLAILGILLGALALVWQPAALRSRPSFSFQVLVGAGLLCLFAGLLWEWRIFKRRQWKQAEESWDGRLSLAEAIIFCAGGLASTLLFLNLSAPVLSWFPWPACATGCLALLLFFPFATVLLMCLAGERRVPAEPTGGRQVEERPPDGPEEAEESGEVPRDEPRSGADLP
jgi:hypothetical protein